MNTIETNTPTTNQKQGMSPMTVFIIAVLIGGAFLIGKLYSEVNLLREGKGVTAQGQANPKTGTDTTGQQPVVTPQAQETFPAVDMASVDAVTTSDHIRGDANAPVVLIEYSDTDCPYCKTFHATMKQIMDEYQGKVAWVYRHYPLEQLHPGAPKEAEATQCVAELAGQDAFWKYLDAVVNTTLDVDGLVKLASSQGLNGNAVEQCITSGKQAAKIAEQLQSGQKAGITGTPGTLLVANGKTKLIPGAYPYADVKKLIDEALAQ